MPGMSGGLEVGRASVAGGGLGGGWPSRQQLHRLLEEDDIEEGLRSLGCGSVADLCRRLGSDPQDGLPSGVPDLQRRVELYGGNWFTEKKLKAYWQFCYEAIQDKILVLLLCIGTVELVVKMIFVPQERRDGWIEPVAIYVTVLIIVNVQSTLDWKRERLFDSLSKKLAASNLRYVVRGGRQETLSDDKLVVGDILALNSHLAAMVPCDGVLVSGDGVKTDESMLSGESEPVTKSMERPFMISGTTVSAGQGKMLVIAVGEHSVAGRIKKEVYEVQAEASPLFTKLDRMAVLIGRAGTCVAAVVFVATCVQGFAIRHAPASETVDYLLLALGVLAVAVPEGLPLALTISLALSSSRMSYQNNLVKTLDSCETMGSVTTICTDKTGTLTANRMTVRAAYLGTVLFQPDPLHPAELGSRVKDDPRLSESVKELTAHLISICTMDESHIGPPAEGSAEPRFHGNPTECALLKFAQDCGFSYGAIRQSTEGRSEASRARGSVKAFSSSRKMMSWAVPRPDGGYRVYAKGASEIILSRVVAVVGPHGEVREVAEEFHDRALSEVVAPFASRAFRTIGLAYRDVDSMPGDDLHSSVLNADGSQAFVCETELTLVGIVGIADPLRPEVPPAIRQCYRAGIDVRMVTGDNLATAVAIASDAGILDPDLHFDEHGKLKPFRAMEGKAFRSYVHRYTEDGDPVFLQERFDEIWPFLRVLARSSPEDKLTLAKGLNASQLYQNKEECRRLKLSEGIAIFPDRQVIAMTGDGTNDAPALKAADVGFAMGIAGTQIAKDAANIILLDDNFASIVTAAKWGRNVFDSIQKFLQFQLTVNIAILAIQLIVSFAGVPPPLGLLHMLWLNMIMDSLASIALASEPPTEAQLRRPPVNRSDFIITGQMWWNMLGQALYQVVVTTALLFNNERLPGCEDETGRESKHYTVLFNTFVFFQLFNEYNSRFLLGEFNILQGLLANPTFLAISAVTFALQVLMTQLGGTALGLHPDGLDGVQWAVCLGVGAGPLVWQPFISAAKRIADNQKLWACSDKSKAFAVHSTFVAAVFFLVLGVSRALAPGPNG